MTRPSKENRPESELALHIAAEFDERLRRGDFTDVSFAEDNQRLSTTLETLNAAFRTDDAGQTLDVGDMPAQIARFRIKRQLGSGGFGFVYLAHDPLLDREVAIKIARRDGMASPEATQRLLRERRLTAAMNHPNIVPVFESGHDGSFVFTVSEFCPGPTLGDWLRGPTQDGTPTDANQPPHAPTTVESTQPQESPRSTLTTPSDPASDQIGRQVPPIVAAHIIRLLADAVDHAHQAGILHRDIKPGNVLLPPVDVQRDGLEFVPRLTDFGLAREVVFSNSSTLTGTFLGTLRYVSPEQARGVTSDLTAASDVYSLGVILYEMLTGEVPFSEEAQIDTLRRICDDPPVSPRRRNSEIPRDLQEICLRCLEKHPDRRFLSAADLRDDLDRYLRGEPTVARPIGPFERIGRWAKRAPAAAALLFVSMLSLTGMLAGMTFHSQQVQKHSAALADALQVAREQEENARLASIEAALQRERARETSYRSDMRLAFDLWQRDEIQPVLEILTRHAIDTGVDLRGPEWYVLNSDLRAKYRTLTRHDGGVTECVLSKDQATVYSSGVDGTVRIRKLSSDVPERAMYPEIGEIHALALSPDESIIAVGGKPWLLDQAHVVLLDAATGQRLRMIQNHSTTIESIAFSPDGTWVAAGSRYQPVQLTRQADGKEFLLPSETRNRTVTFSQDSTLLCLAESKTQFTLWQLDADEPRKLSAVQPRKTDDPYVCRFAPRSSLLAVTAIGSFHVDFFDPAIPGSCGTALGRSDQSVVSELRCLAFSSDERTLAAGDDTGRVLLWHPECDRMRQAASEQSSAPSRIQPLAIVNPHDSRVTTVEVTDENQLISGGNDGRVMLTSPFASGLAHVRIDKLATTTTAIHGTDLWLGCDDGTIRCLSLEDCLPDADSFSNPDSTPTRPSIGPTVLIDGLAPVSGMSLSADGSLIAVGTNEGGALLFRSDTAELIHRLAEAQPDVDGNDVVALAFATDGSLVAHTGQAGFVAVHDTMSGRQTLRQYVGNTSTVTFVDDRHRLACGGQYEVIRFFDAKKGTAAGFIVGEQTNCAVVSADNQWLASAHSGGEIQLAHLASESSPRIIHGHRGHGRSIAFTPNSRSVVSVDNRGIVQFTDVESGAVPGRFRLPHTPTGADRYFVHCTATHLIITVAGANSETDIYVWYLAE